MNTYSQDPHLPASDEVLSVARADARRAISGMTERLAAIHGLLDTLDPPDPHDLCRGCEDLNPLAMRGQSVEDTDWEHFDDCPVPALNVAIESLLSRLWFAQRLLSDQMFQVISPTLVLDTHTGRRFTVAKIVDVEEELETFFVEFFCPYCFEPLEADVKVRPDVLGGFTEDECFCSEFIARDPTTEPGVFFLVNEFAYVTDID